MPWQAGERLLTGLVAASLVGEPPVSEGVRVHMEVVGDDPRAVVLHQIEPPAGPDGRAARPAITHVPVCEAPCDGTIDLARGHDFLVDGPQIPGSRAFSLREEGEALTLQVRPGRRGVLLTGWTLTILGAATVLAGFVTFALGNGDGRRVGGIVAGAGAPVTAVGAIMIAFGRTRVEVLPAARAEPAGSRPHVRGQ